MGDMQPEKARRMVRDAVKRGTLVRPSTCESCGKSPAPRADGGASIQGHHHDYNRPLDVQWLCAKCHRAITPLPAVMGAPVYGDANGMRKYKGLMTGSKNSFAKLDENTVAKIKASRHMTAKQLASIHGVRIGTINDIRLGRTWKHVH